MCSKMLNTPTPLSDPLTTGAALESGDAGLEPKVNGTEEITHFSRPASQLPANPFLDPGSGDHRGQDSGLLSQSFPIVLVQKRPFNPFRPETTSEDEDEDDVEFEKRFSKLEPKGPVSPSPGKSSQVHFFERETVTPDQSDEDEVLPVNGMASKIINNNFRESGDSFNLPSLNGIRVRGTDVGLSFLTFLAHLLSFTADSALVVLYYVEGQKWGSGLTFSCLMVGGLGILHQFGLAEKDRLDRLFKHGRRVRILINSCPPAGTLISSYSCLRSAWKARRDQMFCVKYFALEEFSQGLSRVQGFFGSAPQATIQLVILMESLEEVRTGTGLLILLSIGASLSVMTLSNLPSRNELVEGAIRRGPQVHAPTSRLFLGLRMISSFGSRTMAMGYFFMGLRCLLERRTFPSVIFGLSAILVPRLMFATVDYLYHRHRVKHGRESAQTGRLSCSGTMTGYLATTFFPMSEPVWIFWFIWIETAVFMLWGNISWSLSPTCLSNLTNAIYTGTFLVTFVVIPIMLPYARATMRQGRAKRMGRVLGPPAGNHSLSSSNTSSSTPNLSTDAV